MCIRHWMHYYGFFMAANASIFYSTCYGNLFVNNTKSISNVGRFVQPCRTIHILFFTYFGFKWFWTVWYQPDAISAKYTQRNARNISILCVLSFCCNLVDIIRFVATAMLVYPSVSAGTIPLQSPLVLWLNSVTYILLYGIFGSAIILSNASHDA